jgi:phosphatidylserine/phosphatidylglycerophosphate/cardiolipin synthase-like enzyme
MPQSAPSKPRPLKFQFSWRSGNRFELLIDGPCFFPRMLAAIEQAQHQVLLEMYLVESGAVTARFIDALADAARRGVAVKLLLDDYGARELETGDRERLRAAGVELVFYNPLRGTKLLGNLFRDHRKLLLVDDRVAFVGGAGLTDEFDPPANPAAAWRETMLELRGPVLADWQTLFLEVWDRHAGVPAAQPALAPVAAGASRGRVVSTRGLLRQDIKRSLLARLRGARGRVWLATAYFFPPWRLRRLLRRAARRGIDVRLLLPGPVTDHPAARHAGRYLYHRLLESGVRIFEYQPRFLHQKAVLCDNWVSLGSTNLDRWNLRWNLEANQEVADAVFARTTQEMFERDFRDATEVRLDTWQRRPWYARVLEYAWSVVAMWAERLGRRKDVY